MLEYTFKSGKATQSTFGMEYQFDYEVEDGKIIVDTKMGKMVLRINDDGSLDGPFGRLEKVKAAAVGTSLTGTYFNKDGQISFKSNNKFKISNEISQKKKPVEGKYRIDGKKLILTAPGESKELVLTLRDDGCIGGPLGVLRKK